MDNITIQLLREIPAATAHVESRLEADFKDGNNPRVPLSCALPTEIHNTVKLAGRLSTESRRSVKNLFANHLERSLQRNGHKVTVKYKWRNIEICYI